MSKSASVHGLDLSNGGGQEADNDARLFERAALVMHVRIFRQCGQSVRAVPPPRSNVPHRRHSRGGNGREQHDTDGCRDNDVCDAVPHSGSGCRTFSRIRL